MSILTSVPARGKAPPHDDFVCGLDRETSCPDCRAAWPSDELWEQQALEAMADDQAMIDFRLAERPTRLRGPERSIAILQMLRLAKTMMADPEFRGVARFVFDVVMNGGPTP